MSSPAFKPEWSHDRVRAVLTRPSDGGPPALPPDLSAPQRDPKTGRFLPGNAEYRRRVVKAHAKSLASLDPATVGPWLRPHVAEGAKHAADLAARFPDPALARLVVDAAAAGTTYRALLALASGGDQAALREARGWLREYRSCLATLSALSGATVQAAQPSALATMRAKIGGAK